MFCNVQPMFFKISYKKLQVLYILIYLKSMTSSATLPFSHSTPATLVSVLLLVSGNVPTQGPYTNYSPAHCMSPLVSTWLVFSLLPNHLPIGLHYCYLKLQLPPPPKQLTLWIPFSLLYSFILHNTYYFQIC